MAWDWVNKKLYWTDADDNDIEVIDPVTNHRKLLISTGSTANQPTGNCIGSPKQVSQLVDNLKTPIFMYYMLLTVTFLMYSVAMVLLN